MKKLILVLTVFFVSVTCVSAETAITAKVDKTSLTTDEAVTYTLSIVSSERAVPAPQFTSLKGFDVLSQVQSSNIAFVEGGMKTSLEYTLVLHPQSAGELTIPPAVITVGGKKLSSESFALHVAQGKIKPQPRIPPQPSRLPPGLGKEPQYEL